MGGPNHAPFAAPAKRRDISQTTLEPPLGSGAYKIKSFEPERSVVYELVPDYWARDLPINVGTNNLRELRFDYFRDRGVAFEAFKAGALDWHTETVAKNWATGYDFPAALKKQVIREEFPIRNIGSMQAFAFNTRRTKFKDPRVRRALNFAFDFEKLNEELFYGASRGSRAISRGPNWPLPGCQKVASSNCCRRSGPKFHRKYSPHLFGTRLPVTTPRSAPICWKRCGYCSTPASR
jgi:ABC-type oligopeptide transport system substrate-binding subunit